MQLLTRSFKVKTDQFAKPWLSHLSSYQKYRHAQSELMNVSLWADKLTLGGNHKLLFYIEQLNSNYSSETDRNLQFPIKTDLKCRAWLDQVQSAENSCFPSSWHIIIHRRGPSGAAFVPQDPPHQCQLAVRNCTTECSHSLWNVIHGYMRSKVVSSPY